MAVEAAAILAEDGLRHERCVVPNFPEKLYLCRVLELDIQGFENIPLRLGHLCEDMTVLSRIFNLGQRLHLLKQFAHRVLLDEFR